MKKKQKNSKLLQKELRCTCCKNEVYSSDIKEMKSIPISAKQTGFDKVDLEFLSNYTHSSLHRDDHQWACDTCIEQKKAVKANPDKQTYCDHLPILAYYDQKYNCKSCEVEFIFSKEEQKFWYEELNFWVQSKPKHCKECRKLKRKEKEYHKRINELKEKETSLNAKELSELAVIYEYFGNEVKRNMYLNKLKSST